ncbi:MAG: GNAT family N-acetyltransferase [Zoogloeaceae bacterium]|jgi:ribosomal protein S18 acetylase RimI-like enzyme|nr:GNAT family N-acetyltransferase [Zoogloeaceae bacterium]
MPTLSFTIRPATDRDIPAVIELARETWQDVYPGIIPQAQIDFMLAERYAPARLHEDIAAAGKWLDLAIADDRAIGFAFCEIRRGEYKLDRLYIHPEKQGKGVGSGLIAHAAARAKVLGYASMILSVNKRNEKAIRAYRKNGFSVREAVRAEIGQGFVMDDYIMEKKC